MALARAHYDVLSATLTFIKSINVPTSIAFRRPQTRALNCAGVATNLYGSGGCGGRPPLQSGCRTSVCKFLYMTWFLTFQCHWKLRQKSHQSLFICWRCISASLFLVLTSVLPSSNQPIRDLAHLPKQLRSDLRVICPNRHESCPSVKLDVYNLLFTQSNACRSQWVELRKLVGMTSH